MFYPGHLNLICKSTLVCVSPEGAQRTQETVEIFCVVTCVPKRRNKFKFQNTALHIEVDPRVRWCSLVSLSSAGPQESVLECVSFQRVSLTIFPPFF